MSTLSNHLEKSSDILFREGGRINPHEVVTYVLGFVGMVKPNIPAPQFSDSRPPEELLQAIKVILEQQDFRIVMDYGRSRVSGYIECDDRSRWLQNLNHRRQELHLRFTVEITVLPERTVEVKTSHKLPSWFDEFKERLGQPTRGLPPLVVPGSPKNPRPGTVRRDPTVLKPGESLTEPFQGALLDYSGFATEEEASDLTAVAGLPLGVQAFGFWNPALRAEEQQIDWGKMLYLTKFRYSDALRENNGVLICAPQNSGKTELIVRWAKAANAAGKNVFLVDVKGNMREKLGLRNPYGLASWKGRIYYLTTNPREPSLDELEGEDATLTPDGLERMTGSHVTNFLEGLDVTTAEGRVKIQQVAAALLPREGFESGEDNRYYQNLLVWLTAMIQIVLLHAVYYDLLDGAAPDLGDVYDVASDEEHLLQLLQKIVDAETQMEQEGRKNFEPSAGRLFLDVAVLLGTVIERSASGKPNLIGQRAEYTYRWLTQSICNALQPFALGETLFSKTHGYTSKNRFSFQWLAGLNEDGTPSSAEDPGAQVTIILAARLQDEEAARTLLSLSIARLQQSLFERIEVLSTHKLRPVLLLLDETRRIRGFKVNEYVTYAREAQAGCVAVYQSLDQIGNEERISELLENVGSQIYLGSLTGNTAKYFIASLPKRSRPKFSFSVTKGGPPSNTIQTGEEEIAFISTAETYRLPAGRYPALVYLNDQPRRLPILVAMDKDRLT